MVTDANMDIIYVRAYNGGSLIPIRNVKLVTVDPNSGNIVQEIPMIKCVEDLMQYNMHNFVRSKEDWQELDSYSIVDKG
jgi:hypothetical protein